MCSSDLSDNFAQMLMRVFQDGIVERFGPDAKLETVSEGRLVRDFSQYALTPHTDTPRKLVSLLYYLPPDDSLRHLGTSLHVPRDPSFRCDGSRHHTEEQFLKVATAEYLPNALFGFFKNDRAFHGIDEIQGENIVRDSLLYNLYVDKVIPGSPTAGTGEKAEGRPRGFSLPWRRG